MAENKLLTEKDLPWLYDFTVTKGNIDSILETHLVKRRGGVGGIEKPHAKAELGYDCGLHNGFEKARQAILKAIEEGL